ncbi:MAG: hypothetical protein GXO86_10620 [Chlorobi bacterium]|nr:hypothetical protein [Chlorobiota bacterium]
MLKSIIILVTIIIFPAFVIAQCTAYLPPEGTTLTYANYNKKGKQASTTTTRVTKVETKGDELFYHVHQLISTGKKKDDMESDLVFKCIGNEFIIDMQSVMNPEQMEAYKDGTITVTSNKMAIPGDLEPGMDLEDGELKMVVHMEPMTINISARAFYRKVEAKEEITVPAGTFTAYKIKGYMETKFAFMRFAYKSVDWYVPDLGIVRSESYDNKDKLLGYTELIKIEK